MPQHMTCSEGHATVGRNYVLMLAAAIVNAPDSDQGLPTGLIILFSVVPTGKARSRSTRTIDFRQDDTKAIDRDGG